MGMTVPSLARTAVQDPPVVGTLTDVIGRVRVNGTSAISGATVFSDSSVTTAKGSSAVVSLGKLGRVEVMPSTRMFLRYDDTSITIMLSAGVVRVETELNVMATVVTNDGVITSDSTQTTSFVVDTYCHDTVVSVGTGRVELRAGNTVKQIAAGNQDTAGQAIGRCRER
jgi:ferric-dicitrate binding protein FerR (iron transport regulator)